MTEREKFLKFLKQMDSAADKFQDFLTEKVMPAAEKAWKISRASETAKYASMGLVISGFCEDADEKSMRFLVSSYIEKISATALNYIRAYQAVMLHAYQLHQAWEAIPTFEEWIKAFQDEMTDKLARALLGTIAGLIKAGVCGTKYQRLLMFSCKGILSRDIMIAAIMASLKSTWDAISAESGEKETET